MNSKQIPLSCPGHTRPVVDLAFSDVTENGFFLISACKDGKPMLRLGDTGDWIGTFEGHKGAVWGATLNHTATLAATAAADFTAKVWNAVDGAETQTFTHKHIVKSVDFSSTDDKLLTGSNEKKMKIFDLNCPDKDPQKVLEPLGGNPRTCVWLNNDQNILSGGDEKHIRLWDVRTLSEVSTITFETPLLGMQLSRDKSILSASYGKTVSFYNPMTLDLLKTYTMQSNINSVSISPDKSIFVAGGDNFLVYKYGYDSGDLLESYHGHFGPVHCVEFSPDGELYATGSEDGTLRLWQTTVGKTYGLWRTLDPVTAADAGDEKPRTIVERDTELCNGVGS